MYGKFFASTYTGSMLGAGADVFAVWGYVIANTVDAQVELNPKLLAAVLGMQEKNVNQAISYLCTSDMRSRSKMEDGKRLIREGEFAYRVPTFFTYRKIRNEDDRREYNRKKKAEQRAREKSKSQVVDTIGVKTRVIDSQAICPMSAQAEAEAYSETYKSNSDETRARDPEPGLDIELQVRKTAASYPKIADPRNLSHEVALAIAEAIARDGFELVYAGTRSMADAVSKWPKTEMRFIPAAPRYFRESQYLKDPVQWERTNGNGNKRESLAERNRNALREMERRVEQNDAAVLKNPRA